MTRRDAALLGGISLKLSRPSDYYQKLGAKGGRPKKQAIMSTNDHRSDGMTLTVPTRDYTKLLKLCSEELNGGGK